MDKKDIKYVQAGAMAFRDLEGNFLSPIPLFIRAEDLCMINPSSSLTARNEIDSFAKFIAQNIKIKEG